MPTTKLNLPLIDGTNTADVVRDMNALANAVDNKAGASDGLATLDATGKVPASQLSDRITLGNNFNPTIAPTSFKEGMTYGVSLSDGGAWNQIATTLTGYTVVTPRIRVFRYDSFAFQEVILSVAIGPIANRVLAKLSRLGGSSGWVEWDVEFGSSTGSGSPEGVQLGLRGMRFFDITNNKTYIKTTGTNTTSPTNTGWVQL